MPDKQLYLDKDMAPPSNPDIEQALDGWLEAKIEQKNAAETTKTRHAVLLLHMQTAGVDAYPYTDPTSGKKKHVVAANVVKAKVINAPKWNRRDADADVGDEVEKPDAEKVESRRVKRSQVKDADKIVDPFGATRASMESDVVTPRKAKGRKR